MLTRCMFSTIRPCDARGVIRRAPLQFHKTMIKLVNAMSSRQYNVSSTPSQWEAERIHVLGVGNIGLLFAHSLAMELNAPPITLLVHRPELLEEWEKNGRNILLVKRDIPVIASAFDVELLSALGAEPQSKIANLIVATKATKAVGAVSAIAHRLTPASTILFTQNGMGVISKINANVFPGESQRPCYLAAVNSHGVKSTPSKPFQAVHAGIGKVTVGFDPSSTVADAREGNGQGTYLLDKIVRAENLVATEVDAKELLHLQLEKLIVNSIINPLTTVLDCENGALFKTEDLRFVIRKLAEEAVEVINGLPGLRPEDRFDIERVIDYVNLVGHHTSSNTSSMLQDSRAGRETEIDYINGWIIDKGKEMGKEVGHHKLLMRLVNDGRKLSFSDISTILGEPSAGALA